MSTIFSASALAAFAAGASFALRRRLTTRAAAQPASDKFSAVCVFCGSSTPQKTSNGEQYIATARVLGAELGNRGLKLVYGGGGVGIMGEVARSADAAGAVVKGIIPTALMPRELSGDGVQMHNVEATETMHERKARMAELSSAFIALPGGFGTFEELLEMITWTQLGVHDKPIGVLNVAGFYDDLLAFFQRAVDEGFIGQDRLDILVVDSDPIRLLDRLAEHKPPAGICEWVKP